jgi:hypothetical protein
MPRIAAKSPKVRLNLEVPAAVRDRLERLRDDSGADTLTEVVRRSLEVYEVLLNREPGAEIVLRMPDGREKVVILV